MNAKVTQPGASLQPLVRRRLSLEEREEILGEMGALGDLIALCQDDIGTFRMDGYTERENESMWKHLRRLRDEFGNQYRRLEMVLQAHCDHKFVDSTRCLKCGWEPPNDKLTDRR